jgi:hypothetical protein
MCVDDYLQTRYLRIFRENTDSLKKFIPGTIGLP